MESQEFIHLALGNGAFDPFLFPPPAITADCSDPALSQSVCPWNLGSPRGVLTGNSSFSLHFQLVPHVSDPNWAVKLLHSTPALLAAGGSAFARASATAPQQRYRQSCRRLVPSALLALGCAETPVTCRNRSGVLRYRSFLLGCSSLVFSLKRSNKR